MARIDEQTKRQRKDRVQLIVAGANGLRESEIAARAGLEQRTTHNYLRELEYEGQVYKQGLLWHGFDVHKTKLRSFELSPEEAYTLYLAARLLVKQQDKRNEPAETALLKLAKVLSSDLGVGSEIAQAAAELAKRPAKPGYQSVFRTVVQGYLYRRQIELVYRPYGGRPFTTVFSPYLLEPSAIGFTTYAIGHSSTPNALRAYRLDRIDTAQLALSAYLIPSDFAGLDILRNAWSIMIGETTTRVVLRFSPAVKERVLETRWHPSQDSMDDPDKPGHLRWWVDVADTTDMKPWVRSWGADCEVLEPESLRKTLEAEARRLGSLYQLVELPKTPLYQLLWAKFDRKTGRSHPLICHLLDVAHVTMAIWDDVLTESIRQQFAAALNLDAETTGRLLAFWAGLHDIGKASPAFQRKVKAQEAALNAAGLPFPRLYSQESAPHGTISTCVLDDLLQIETGLAARPAKRIALALGGHHGSWPPPGAAERIKDDQIGGSEWDDVRRELVRALWIVLEPPTLTSWIANRTKENVFLTLFSGLTSVADWIGSSEIYFPYVEAPVEPRRYAERAAAQARAALDDLGWTDYQPPAEKRSFADLFPFSPNTVQKAAVELADQLEGPALVLIESPTGSGKTEAALFLADNWAHKERQRGLYVAMPTMATSNQMHGRVAKALNQRYGSDVVKPLLIHSQARWMPAAPPPEIVSDEETDGASTRSMTWFLPRKRSLLTPFGVGTVDQSLISVLQTRHFFVRLFGLSHKTVIFDEVHAYDTYMSVLFQRLLTWLRAAGASVVLLSATLPAQTRRELIQAYGGKDVTIPESSYPSITWTASGQAGVVPLPQVDSRIVMLDWLTRDPAAIVAQLRSALREGGCAAVICNTVKRSQEVYCAVREAGLVAQEDLVLFHARTPFAWRDVTEKNVLARFGKDGDRPQKSIVIATQVIEQSLDLDFDVMISDLAPVDLLIQRAGRLHRHIRSMRPAPLDTPRFTIAVNEGEEFPQFGSDAYVYEPYVLLRSLLTLQGRDCLILPQETSDLIEAVYSDVALENLPQAWEAKLAKAREKMTRGEDKEVFEAKKRLVLDPSAQNLMTSPILSLEEDAPAVHEAFQALTRLSDPSVSLVCLHAIDGSLNTEPDGSGQTVRLDEKPDNLLTGHLAQHTVALTHRRVFEYYTTQEAPAGWRDHPLLRDHRVAVFSEGGCELPITSYTLRLSRELGLEITKA